MQRGWLYQMRLAGEHLARDGRGRGAEAAVGSVEAHVRVSVACLCVYKCVDMDQIGGV